MCGPGLGSGWTGSWGYQERVGTPGGTPSPRVHMASGLRTLAPPLRPFVPRRKRAWQPGRWWWGGVSCCPCSQHPPPGWALHSARLGALGGTRWAGGRGRNIPPRVPTGPGGRRQRLAPPRRHPPSSVERSWQGWRSQFGIAGASTRPQARPVCEPGPWPGVLGRRGAGALTPVRGPCSFLAQPRGLVSVSGEPWRLLWLREGDRLGGLTTRPAV